MNKDIWGTGLKDYLEKQNRYFLEQCQDSSEKYHKVWEYYKEHMPLCIKECTEKKKSFSFELYRDGPQGIYWIGKDPAIFFIGREPRGWYGERAWPDDIDTICYSPLHFTFYTSESIGNYWGIINGITYGVLKVEENGYKRPEILGKLAFSNACKCYSENNKNFRWHLHENCKQHKYVSKEIEIVNARVNVLFTKSYPLLDKIFDSNIEVFYKGKEFNAGRHGEQIIIECDHPVRKSSEWRTKLKKIIEKYM